MKILLDKPDLGLGQLSEIFNSVYVLIAYTSCTVEPVNQDTEIGDTCIIHTLS